MRASSSHPTLAPISCAASSSPYLIASHSARYFLSRGSFSSPMGVRYSVSSPTASLTCPFPPESSTSLAKSPTTTTLSGSHSPSPSASS